MTTTEFISSYNISRRTLTYWRKGFLWETRGVKKKAKSKLPSTRVLNEHRRWERSYNIRTVMEWVLENGVTLHQR